MKTKNEISARNLSAKYRQKSETSLRIYWPKLKQNNILKNLLKNCFVLFYIYFQNKGGGDFPNLARSSFISALLTNPISYKTNFSTLAIFEGKIRNNGFLFALYKTLC